MTKQARTICMTLVLAAGVSLGVSPADAQKKNKEEKGGKNKDRVEQVRRERDRDDRYERRDVRYDDRYDNRQSGRKKGVPPGWCIGRGNPHNTVENCGRDGERYDPRYDDRRDRRSDDGRYDDRYDRGSFEERHDYFHRMHDAQCRERAAQRPLDVRWQIQVRTECNAEHERWHARNDPARYNQPTLQRRP